MSQTWAIAVGGCIPPKRRSNHWDKISVSSSGEAKLQNITDGASKVSNVKKENILMRSHGKQLNQNRHVEKSRVIGGGITEVEVNGNNEIDVGSPALLKRAHRHGHGHHGHHGHGHGHYGHHGYGRRFPSPCWNPRPWGGYGGYGGYGCLLYTSPSPRDS